MKNDKKNDKILVVRFAGWGRDVYFCDARSMWEYMGIRGGLEIEAKCWKERNG